MNVEDSVGASKYEDCALVRGVMSTSVNGFLLGIENASLNVDNRNVGKKSMGSFLKGGLRQYVNTGVADGLDDMYALLTEHIQLGDLFVSAHNVEYNMMVKKDKSTAYPYGYSNFKHNAEYYTIGMQQSPNIPCPFSFSRNDKTTGETPSCIVRGRDLGSIINQQLHEYFIREGFPGHSAHSDGSTGGNCYLTDDIPYLALTLRGLSPPHQHGVYEDSCETRSLPITLMDVDDSIGWNTEGQFVMWTPIILLPLAFLSNREKHEYKQYTGDASKWELDNDNLNYYYHYDIYNEWLTNFLSSFKGIRKCGGNSIVFTYEGSQVEAPLFAAPIILSLDENDDDTKNGVGGRMVDGIIYPNLYRVRHYWCTNAKKMKEMGFFSEQVKIGKIKTDKLRKGKQEVAFGLKKGDYKRYGDLDKLITDDEVFPVPFSIGMRRENGQFTFSGTRIYLN